MENNLESQVRTAFGILVYVRFTRYGGVALQALNECKRVETIRWSGESGRTEEIEYFVKEIKIQNKYIIKFIEN